MGFRGDLYLNTPGDDLKDISAERRVSATHVPEDLHGFYLVKLIRGNGELESELRFR